MINYYESFMDVNLLHKNLNKKMCIFTKLFFVILSFYKSNTHFYEKSFFTPCGSFNEHEFTFSINYRYSAQWRRVALWMSNLSY